MKSLQIHQRVCVEAIRKRPVLYVSYVGKHDTEHIFKYGKSADFERRFKQHMRTFPIFDLRYLQQSYDKDYIENEITGFLKMNELHRSLTLFSGKRRQTELFTVTNNIDLDNVLEFIDLRIKQYDQVLFTNMSKNHIKI